MNLGKVVFISFLSLSLVGCAALGYQFLGSGEQAQIMQNTPVVVAGKTATPTILPTATVTPWYDAEATRLAVDADLAAAQKARDELLLLEKQMTKDAGDTTNQIALDASYRQNLEVEARVTLAFSNATATAQAYQHQAEMEKSSLEIEQKWQDISMLLIWVGVGLALFFVFALALKWWRETASSEIVTEQEEVTINETQAPPGFIPVSPITFHPNNVPVSDDKFRVWAQAMLKGGSAGENKWTTAESPFSTATYPPFLAWAEERGYVEYQPGIGKPLTETGRKFCEEWLLRRNFSPTD